MKLWKVVFFVMLLSLLCGLASATTLEVGDGYTYSTVNSALDAATNGDTILVHPGTYNEYIIISNMHDITLQGEGYPLILYQPTSGDNPCIRIGSNAYNITIQGLHLNNTGTYIQYHGGIRAATYATYGNVFKDNIIETYRGDGIWLDGVGTTYQTPNQNNNNTLIYNNTIRTKSAGRGIFVGSETWNLSILHNNVSATYSYSDMLAMNSGEGAYGIRAENIHDSLINDNIVWTCSYSLIKTGGANITIENNTAYGDACHNCYEYGYRSAIFKNNTLINTNLSWSQSGHVAPSLNNFYNPGGYWGDHMIFDEIHSVNSSTGRILSVGGHHNNVLIKNTTINANQNHLWDKVIVYGFSGTNIFQRTSDGIIFDNFSVENHKGVGTVPMWIQGAGTDSTPATHLTNDFTDITRDNITLYDCVFPNNSYSNPSTYYDNGTAISGPTSLGLFADSQDTNVSIIFANSPMSIFYLISGGIVSSTEWYWFTDINVTDGGQPAGTSRIFITSNTTRTMYNETVPYFDGDYVDESQDNYTYQQTDRGRLNTPQYIETLSNGQTGTRSTPENCLLLASSTQSLTSPKSGPIISRNVYYNITVSSGAYNTSCFYTVPAGMQDTVTVDSTGAYSHFIGTKIGTQAGFHPTNAQYKNNSYERGTVDLTIPVSDYEETIIPMGVAL